MVAYICSEIAFLEEGGPRQLKEARQASPCPCHGKGWDDAAIAGTCDCMFECSSIFYNDVLIFELDPRNHLTHQQFMEVRSSIFDVYLYVPGHLTRHGTF